MHKDGEARTILGNQHAIKARRWWRASTAALLCGLLATVLAPAAGRTQETRAGSGEAGLPRFVSLKASRVNLRKGPGTEYPTAWVFRRAGLPVEIVREYQLWREVRDAEGTTGWVLNTLLSARRTAQVAPWDAGKAAAGSDVGQIPILARKSDSARRVVIVEPGVITDLHSCDGNWCRVSVAGYTGFIRQAKLWGIYPNETLD